MWVKLLKHPTEVTRYGWMVDILNILEEIVPIETVEGERPYQTFQRWWDKVKGALFRNESHDIYWQMLTGM